MTGIRPLPLFLALLAPPSTASEPCRSDAHRAFDFWIGDWDVEVQGRSFGSGRGLEEKGQLAIEVRPALGGCAIVEHARLVSGEGVPFGFSARTYNPTQKVWEALLLWPGQDRPAPYTMDGQVDRGRAEFFAVRTIPNSESPILVRYSFSDVTPQRVRWQGDVASPSWGPVDFESHDAEVWFNDGLFLMDRRPSHADALPPPATEVRPGRRWCEGVPFRSLDSLLGSWAAGSTHYTVQPILGGCALEERLDRPEGSAYAVMAYVPQEDRWLRWEMATTYAGIHSAAVKIDNTRFEVHPLDDQKGVIGALEVDPANGIRLWTTDHETNTRLEVWPRRTPLASDRQPTEEEPEEAGW